MGARLGRPHALGRRRRRGVEPAAAGDPRAAPTATSRCSNEQLNATTITGNLTVPQRRVVRPRRRDGQRQPAAAAVAAASGSPARRHGNVQATNTSGAGDPMSSGANVICNSTINGNLQIQNSDSRLAVAARRLRPEHGRRERPVHRTTPAPGTRSRTRVARATCNARATTTSAAAATRSAATARDSARGLVETSELDRAFRRRLRAGRRLHRLAAAIAVARARPLLQAAETSPLLRPSRPGRRRRPLP